MHRSAVALARRRAAARPFAGFQGLARCSGPATSSTESVVRTFAICTSNSNQSNMADKGDCRQVALLIQNGPAILVVNQAHKQDVGLWELPVMLLNAAQDEDERQVLEEQARKDPALQQEGAIDALVCAKKVIRAS